MDVYRQALIPGVQPQSTKGVEIELLNGAGLAANTVTYVDPDAVNTPFMQFDNGKICVTYSTGRRHLIPKFGTSEIVFSKLRQEDFVRPQ